MQDFKNFNRFFAFIESAHDIPLYDRSSKVRKWQEGGEGSLNYSLLIINEKNLAEIVAAIRVSP